jgi:hypothetical protein
MRAAPRRLGEPVLRGATTLLERARKVLLAARFRPVISKEGNASTLRVSRSGLKSAVQILSGAGFRRGLVSDLDRAYAYCLNCRAALPMGASRCRRCGDFTGDAHAM